MTIKQMLEEIRRAINAVDRSITEKEVYEALVAEAEGWKMRLDELEDDGD